MPVLQYCLGLVLVLCSVSVFAFDASPSFDGAKRVGHTPAEHRHYVLPMGRIKLDRELGHSFPAKFQRLEGRFQATVWELHNGMSLTEAAQIVQTYVEGLALDRLFSCQSRDCGESFEWANEIFKQPLLYGNDRAQQMWVMKSVNASLYRVFYLVERPSGRIYFYEESLLVDASKLNADVINSQLTQFGRAVVGEIDNNDLAGSIQMLSDQIQGLKKGVKFPVFLVIHRHGNALTSDVKSPLMSALSERNMTEFSVNDVRNLSPNHQVFSLIWVEWVDPDWLQGARMAK